MWPRVWGPLILRGSLRSHLRMTVVERCVPPRWPFGILRSSLFASHTFACFHLPITSRFRAALGARTVSFPGADPERGGRRSAARRTLGLRSRWRGAMPRWQHAAIPLRSGRRPSALHRGDFRPRDHASTPAVFTGSTLRLARRPDRKTWPTGSRTSRAAVRSAGHGTPRSRSVFRFVSGDAPHERERIWCSIDAIRSQ